MQYLTAMSSTISRVSSYDQVALLYFHRSTYSYTNKKVESSANRIPHPRAEHNQTASQLRPRTTIYYLRLSHVRDAWDSASCRPTCAEFIMSRASSRSCDKCSGAGVFDGEEVASVGSASRRAAD